MPEDAWIADEPRLRSVAGRVLARALRRRTRVAAIALLVTGAIVGLRALEAPRYVATLVFQMQEGDLTGPDQVPPLPRDIRQHMAAVALSRDQLERIMRKHRVTEAWLDRDRVAAVESFREDIEIEVSRNYFIYDRSRNDAPRTAHVTLSLLGSDPDVTRALLHDIGDAIVRDQAAQRAGRLAEAGDLFGAELARARDRTRSVQEEIDRLSLAADRASPEEASAIEPRIVALETEARASIERTLVLERRAALAAFGGAAEGGRLGLTFELFDESLTTHSPRLTPPQLAKRAAAVLAVVLLLTALVVGSFDDRIYTPADLAAHGLPLFGTLSRFSGDDARPSRTRPAARA